MVNEYFLYFFIYIFVFLSNFIFVILIRRILEINFTKCFILSTVIGLFFFSFIFFIIKINYLHFILNLFFYFQLNYILLIIFYTPISSVRFNILKILYENNYQIDKKKFFKIYNNKKIFLKRLVRLSGSHSIKVVNKKYYISGIKIPIMLNFFLIIKILFS